MTLVTVLFVFFFFLFSLFMWVLFFFLVVLYFDFVANMCARGRFFFGFSTVLDVVEG